MVKQLSGAARSVTANTVPLVLGLGLLLCLGPGQACSDEPGAPLSVAPAHGWTNVFGGQPAKLGCRITGLAAGDVTLFWSVSVERAVIARGERTLTLAAARASDVTLEVDFPAVRPGLIVPGALSLEVRAGGGLQAARVVPLHVFSPEVAANRQELLKSFDITLFDPDQTTARLLEASKIPFQLTDAPRPRPGTGVLIVGSKIEPARQPAIWQSAVAAAAAGRKVIVLASLGERIPLEGVLTRGAGPDGPTSVSLRRPDFIRELDRRLDAGEWPAPGRLVAASIHWTARSATPQMEFRADGTGWTWLDLRFAGSGRLVWTGIGLTESWESTPAARYLFVKLLDDVMIKPPGSKGSNHAAE